MERKQKAELLKRVFAVAKSKNRNKNMKNKTNKQKIDCNLSKTVHEYYKSINKFVYVDRMHMKLLKVIISNHNLN